MSGGNPMKSETEPRKDDDAAWVWFIFCAGAAALLVLIWLVA